MGACDFESVGFGKTANDAFRQAVSEAQYEYGHGGYTGTIAEKGGDGFIHVVLPARTDLRKLLSGIHAIAWVLNDGRLDFDAFRERSRNRFKDEQKRAKKQGWAMHRTLRDEMSFVTKQINQAKYAVEKLGEREAVRLAHATNDKWGACVCIEVTGAAATKMRERVGYKGRRGIRPYVFIGTASS
jgi:hypothetical protein